MQSEPISGKRLVDVLPDETPVQDGGQDICSGISKAGLVWL